MALFASVRLGSGVSGGAHIGRGVHRSSGNHLHRQRLQHAHHLAVGGVTQRRLGASVATAQELLERVAKVLGAETVDEGIGRRVAVAEPEEDVEENRRGTVSTERLGQVDTRTK